MIKVKLTRDDQMITGFKVWGHAGQSEYGQDIVCSAVTAIVYTALGAMEELTSANKYEDVAEDNENDYVRFSLDDNDVDDEEKKTIAIILKSMEIGLRQIEAIYEDYLEILE